MVSEEVELQFRLLLASITDYAIFMLDPSGIVKTWNQGAERLKGYRAEEILGSSFRCFYPSEDVQLGQPERELELAAVGGSSKGEGWRVRKDGSRFWASVVITAVHDSEGRLVGFGKVTQDITERLQATERFRAALEGAPTGMIMVSNAGTMTLVNAQIERLFGYSRIELVGKPIEILVPARFRPHHPGFRNLFQADPQMRPMGSGRDLYGLRKDGSEVPVEIGLNPLRTSQGDWVLCSVVDITERKRAEEEKEALLDELRVLNAELEERVRFRTAELSKTIKEREVLLQEVHHRVKNNLQVISSLLNMQLRKMGSGASKDALEGCQTRVQAIALIHEKLYQSADYANVPFSDYARKLAANILYAHGLPLSSIVLDVEAVPLALGVDKAIPCGLILNELITNAVKHAFPNHASGSILVKLEKVDGGCVRLTVKDDGIGMDPTIDIATSDSLGLQLISTLAEQLDARVAVTREGGTTFSIDFLKGF